MVELASLVASFLVDNFRVETGQAVFTVRIRAGFAIRMTEPAFNALYPVVRGFATPTLGRSTKLYALDVSTFKSEKSTYIYRF